MESLEGKLGRMFLEMTEAQRKAYKAKAKGGESVEALLNIAESVSDGGRRALNEAAERLLIATRESGRPIRRNNSGTAVEESGYSMEKADEMLLSALAECRPQAFKKKDEVSEASSGLTAKQREDFEFGKAVGLTESEALKVAKSGDIRG